MKNVSFKYLHRHGVKLYMPLEILIRRYSTVIQLNLNDELLARRLSPAAVIPPLMKSVRKSLAVNKWGIPW